MRLHVASCHGLLLLLINLTIRGLSADQKKHDFTRTSTGPNSLMDTMMKKYSYPKSEVTAGVGYGHHLHPLYYQGQKEMMYPCAVECGEWESMRMDDNANDGSSNVDVVTVHPDISTIDMTTTKSRNYKDTSFLRPKKYQSTTAATPKKNMHNDFTYQDSKGAGVKIIPQKSDNIFLRGSNTDKDHTLNDGSLYAKYYDALVSGYDGEASTDSTGNKENEDFDPMEESLRYNPPSFIDSESDDIEAPVYPTKPKSRPDRERIEEKYVKHNVREERLEDVRTNSFGPYEEDEDYPSDSSPGKQYGDQNPSKYIDDYAAPVTRYNNNPNENYEADHYRGRFAGSNGEKPFRPSPPHGQSFRDGENRPTPHIRGQNDKLRPIYDPRGKIPHQDSNGYHDYQDENYGVDQGGTDYDEPPSNSGAYLGPKNYGNKPGRYHGKKYPHGRAPDPRLIRRPSTYGRNRKYPRIANGVANPQRGPYSYSGNLNHPAKQQFPSKPYYGSYPRSPYSGNGSGHSYHPYAPRHGYSSQSQDFPVRSNSGGIRVVSPPRIRAQSARNGKFPYQVKGDSWNGPYVRGQRISYRQTIPQKDGFTKIVKKYRSFVDHTPKRYVGVAGP